LFGFVMLRHWLSDDEVTQLRAEVVSRMRSGHGAAYDERPWMSGMAGHYIPMLDTSAPLSCALVEDDRFHGTAREFAAYLDPLTAATGALRVLPLSHEKPASLVSR
jgi:hypothetical protein